MQSQGNRRGRRKDYIGVRGIKDTIRKPIESTYLGSYGLTETELANMDPVGSELGPLHIPYGCVAWSSYGIPSNGSP